MAEEQWAFVHGFDSYSAWVGNWSDGSSSTGESAYDSDHLADRVVIAELGRGLGNLEVRFENPVVVTSRPDEVLVGIKNISQSSLS